MDLRASTLFVSCCDHASDIPLKSATSDPSSTRAISRNFELKPMVARTTTSTALSRYCARPVLERRVLEGRAGLWTLPGRAHQGSHPRVSSCFFKKAGCQPKWAPFCPREWALADLSVCLSCEAGAVCYEGVSKVVVGVASGLRSGSLAMNLTARGVERPAVTKRKL
jgi:hypothetical protein